MFSDPDALLLSAPPIAESRLLRDPNPSRRSGLCRQPRREKRHCVYRYVHDLQESASYNQTPRIERSAARRQLCDEEYELDDSLGLSVLVQSGIS